jgi:hypothetical protein
MKVGLDTSGILNNVCQVESGLMLANTFKYRGDTSVQ